MAAEDEDDIDIVEEPTTNGAAVTSAKDGMEALKARLAAAQAETAAARRRAEVAEAQAVNSHNYSQDAETAQVESALGKVTTDLEMLSGEFEEALTIGDHKTAAQIQVRMSQAAAAQLTLQQGLEQLKARPKATPRQAPADPVEALASQLTPASAAWVRAHPWYAEGDRYDAMIAAHNLAIRRHKVDTPGYFKAVEDNLRINDPLWDDDTDATTARRRRDADEDEMPGAARRLSGRDEDTPPPPAPVNRSGNGIGGRQGRATLTAAQAEAAEISGMTKQEYWDELQKIEREKAN